MHQHGGNIYRIERERGIARCELLDYSSNVNPLGVPESLKEMIVTHLDDLAQYPDPDCVQSREAIARYQGVPGESLLVGNGTTELLYLAFRLLAPARAVVVAPTFSEYEQALRGTGAGIGFVRLEEEGGFAFSAAAVEEELRGGAALVVICNPNNPTGTFIPRARMEEVAALARSHRARVLIDESFIEFLADAPAASAVGLCGEYDNLVIVRSLTKMFAIPGLRLGYLVVSDPALAARMRAAQEPWRVNVFADMAAQVILADAAYIARTRALIAAEKEFLAGELAGLGWLRVFQPSVNFILAKILDGRTAAAVQERLLAEKVLIRDASNFRFLDERFIRVAVKDRARNERLLGAMRKGG